MTPDGRFQDTAPPGRRGWLDRALGRVGGLAMLLAVASGALVLAGLAVLAIGVLLPVMLVAGAVAFASLWWRLRRGGRLRFVVVRR